MNIEGKNLDAFQLEAIKDNHDSVLLVAAAGSGKTLTILGKIKYLLEHGYKENEILCISFTNKSVNDLKERLEKLNYNCDIKTFHKLSLDILKNKHYSIINENYLEYIIDEYFESYIKQNKLKNKVYKRIVFNDNNNYFKLKNTIKTFIKLAKANSTTINDILTYYKKEYFFNKEILKYILEIITIYNNELKSVNKIDFDNMIEFAIKEVKFVEFQYKYIIIDEFQDSSILRINLIKEIIKKTNSKIFCVGDDYQSIYRFTGCNLEIFLNFKKHFKNSTIHYLKNTYRNANELIEVSTKFIMKNKKQLRKNIISLKHINKPIYLLINLSIKSCIKYINDTELLIIGRNNKDIENINYDNKMTIHSSKGLEANNVLIINSDNMPNKIKNEKILKYVTTDNDYILYEEERRLFYVALTRTKNNVYIQINKKISPFIKELIKINKNYINIIKKVDQK